MPDTRILLQIKIAKAEYFDAHRVFQESVDQRSCLIYIIVVVQYKQKSLFHAKNASS